MNPSRDPGLPMPAGTDAGRVGEPIPSSLDSRSPVPAAEPLLSVRDLDVVFDSYRGPHQVLHQVSFDVGRGEILGVVGESGAGKSMTGLAIAGLIEKPGRVTGGEIRLAGERIDTLRGEDLRRIRGRRIGMVFQDPLTSLNPVFTIGHHLVETIRTHLPVSARQARERAVALLEEVEIPQAAWRLDQYPHQFSGGMRQRVAIALALCAEPELLIADEPTTALDVSVQAQVIRLLRRLCQQRHQSAMLITHDMGVIAETADRVMVMYGGRVLETGAVRQVLDHPAHPYTRALMAAIPLVHLRQHRLPVPDTAHWLEDGEDGGPTTADPVAQADGGPSLADPAAEPGRSVDAPEGGLPAAAALPVDVATGGRQATLAVPAAGVVSSSTPGDAGVPAAGRATVDAAAGGSTTTEGVSAASTAAASAGGAGHAVAGHAAIGVADGPQAAGQPLLEVEGLSRHFDLSSGWLVRLLSREPRRVLKAVDDVGFRIRQGRTFGLVGESGSGKSTVARMVAGLLRPDAGRVCFEGIERWGKQAGSLTAEQRRALRHRCQMIFQDPYASLNPRWPVARLIAEPLDVLGVATDPAEREARVIDMLRHVRMSPDDARKYPHQFSGGQRQRIAIARALISQPDFIICDEPTSALDVSVQAQVLNLMRDLQDEYGLTYLLISHNLAVIRFMCDDIGVMKQGRMVEQGEAAAVLDAPRHAYTRQLLAAVPSLSPVSTSGR